MSFEVYVQCIGETGRRGIPRAAVKSLFPVIEEESEPDWWRVRYDDMNSCEVSVSSIPSDREFLNSLCVFRPCQDPRLWEALIQILRMGSVFICWPGSPAVIAHDSGSHSLPKEITDSLGTPRSVTSVEDILHLLSTT